MSVKALSGALKRSGSSKNSLDKLDKLCMEAIDMNRIFAGLRPMLFRTRILALNAQIACARIGDEAAAIGVMVKELIVMGESLSEIVDDVEVVFADCAKRSAYWLRGRNRLNCLRLALQLCYNDEAAKEQKVPLDVMKHDILNKKTKRVWSDLADKAPEGSGIKMLWTFTSELRNDALSNLIALREISIRLVRLLERLNFVATRQSSFLATTVSIEASRMVTDSAHVSTVTDDIKRLAKDISTIEHAATDRVRSFSADSSNLLGHL